MQRNEKMRHTMSIIIKLGSRYKKVNIQGLYTINGAEQKALNKLSNIL